MTPMTRHGPASPGRRRRSRQRSIAPVAPEYTGPTGRVHGTVTITGDAPPATDFHYPAACSTANETYGKIFRVGDRGALADAMVAITGYDAYVAPKTNAGHVSIHACAVSQRTVVLSFGQRLEVTNTDYVTSSYMPYLDGAPFRAVMVATPNDRPIKLYPVKPGHYLLRDMLPHPFLLSDVFVVPYATFDVTGVDGHFEIEGVPVGKARIDAFLPIIRKSVGHELNVHEGDNEFDLELTYDAKTDKVVQAPKQIWGQRPDAEAPPTQPTSAAPSP